MADGASGNIGGILFEAGKTISDAGKKQAQQIANAAGQQLTGNAKPLFGGGPKQTTTGLPSFKPQTGTGQTPKLDPFGDFGKMFEKNKPGSPFGAKQPPIPPTPQFTQADLDKMAAENSVKDQEEIAKKQAELRQLQQQHKQLHDEVYYNKIRDAGNGSIAQERQARAQQAEEDAAQAQIDAQQDSMRSLPNGVMKNELPAPDQQQSVALTQAKTVTEINRGTTG